MNSNDFPPPKDEEELRRRIAWIDHLTKLDEYEFMLAAKKGREDYQRRTGKHYPRELSSILKDVAITIRHWLGITRKPPKRFP